jgi:hypothetical protein
MAQPTPKGAAKANVPSVRKTELRIKVEMPYFPADGIHSVPKRKLPNPISSKAEKPFRKIRMVIRSRTRKASAAHTRTNHLAPKSAR